LLLLRAAGGQRIEEGASTVPMGILPELDTTPAEPFALEQGDTLLLLTDGFFEWANADGKLFGVQRVFDLVQQNADSSAAELIEQLHREVVRFGENSEQADDLTAIIVKRK
jgi:sigma-B regulation protein RsbU (phosphoserine phosphatase)